MTGLWYYLNLLFGKLTVLVTVLTTFDRCPTSRQFRYIVQVFNRSSDSELAKRA